MDTDFKTGSPNWLDLGTADIDAAAAFYGAVFGWTFQSLGPEAGGYGFLQKDGKTVAALGGLDEGAKSAWTVYFLTPDADATTKTAEQAGGTVRVAPFDVMDAGRMACLTDPTGAEFNIWQPGRTKGLEAHGEDNTFCWAELHSGESPKAVGFYQTLFGWRTEDSGLPGVEYTILATAGGDDQQAAQFGGAAGLMGGMAPHWLPYFATADADATVAKAKGKGGSVLMGPDEVPTVGKIAVLADPAGALFAILQPLPRTV